MNQWELARYLIDAKKAVDGIWFIAQHAFDLRNINLRKEIEDRRSTFYINACTVLDNCITRRQKKDICSQDSIIESIYYQRDKHYAHKDPDYVPKTYNSIDEIYTELKSQILHLYQFCSKNLPVEVTLDFVPHDKQLFRHLYGVTPEKEEEIRKKKHPLYGLPWTDDAKGEYYKIVHDTEDVRRIAPEVKDKYATLIECGLCENESLQNFQDAVIITNVLFNENIWCSPNPENMETFKSLKELGYLNQFDIPKVPNLADPIAQYLFKRDMKKLGMSNAAEYSET